VGAELIIADEPTSMLDVSIRRSVLDLMRRMKETRSITFLYITHDIATAQFIADDIAIMYAGRVVEWGKPDRVIANPQHPYTRLLLSAVPDPAVRLDGGGGKAFAKEAEAVRAICRRAGTNVVEVEPGHFVRQVESAA
jgi:peptide/nickel transport system ATP-binding protein